MTQEKPIPVKHTLSYTAGVLSYLIPGLGQVYQGRVGKGLMFMVCLLGMFLGGQIMGEIRLTDQNGEVRNLGWRNVYIPKSNAFAEDNLVLKQAPNLIRDLLLRWHYGGQFWIGIAAWPALWQYNNMPVPSAEQSPFLHNLQRMPDERELNDYLVTRGKMPDLAWVYTVIAGILNILVIYDAFAGPALGVDEDSGK